MQQRNVRNPTSGKSRPAWDFPQNGVPRYKAGPSGLGGHAQVFSSVWDFSIPGAVSDDGKKKK
jgi:hypothetical protein